MGAIMARLKSSDLSNSLIAVVVVMAFFALLFSGDWFMPRLEGMHWKNVYVFSSSYSDSLFLFVIVLNQVNNAKGIRQRIWLAALASVTGLAGIVFAVSRTPERLPHLGLLEGIMPWAGGAVLAAALRDGVPAQAFRNIFAKGLDYAGRFFPMTGGLICLGLLGAWGWELDQRWAARDYTVIVDGASFLLGSLCVLIAGKRRPVSRSRREYGAQQTS